MALDLSKLKDLQEKLKAAFDRLYALIESGAIQKDIDDQKAVVKEIADQIKTVIAG